MKQTKKLEGEKKELQKKVQQIRAEKEIQEKDFASAKQELREDAKHRQDELRARGEESDALVEELKEKVRNCECLLTTKNVFIKDLQSKIDAQGINAEEAEKMHSQRKGECDRLKGELRLKELANQEQADAIKELRASRDEKEEEIKSLTLTATAEKEAAAREQREKEGERERAARELDRLKNVIREKKYAIIGQEQVIKRKEEEVEESKRRIQELENKGCELQRQHEEVERLNADLKDKVRKSGEKIEALQVTVEVNYTAILFC